MRDEGANAEYLGQSDSHFGKKESVADSARVLGRFFDGILFRGFKQETVEGLAKYSGVPVYNGLTNEFHPTQILADFLTIKEHFGRLDVYNGGNRLLCACRVYHEMRKSGLISQNEQIAYSILAFIFCADVVVAIVAFARARGVKKRLVWDQRERLEERL